MADDPLHVVVVTDGESPDFVALADLAKHASGVLTADDPRARRRSKFNRRRPLREAQ
jgi:hypothetical protein